MVVPFIAFVRTFIGTQRSSSANIFPLECIFRVIKHDTINELPFKLIYTAKSTEMLQFNYNLLHRQKGIVFLLPWVVGSAASIHRKWNAVSFTYSILFYLWVTVLNLKKETCRMHSPSEVIMNEWVLAYM